MFSTPVLVYLTTQAKGTKAPIAQTITKHIGHTTCHAWILAEHGRNIKSMLRAARIVKIAVAFQSTHKMLIFQISRIHSHGLAGIIQRRNPIS